MGNFIKKESTYGWLLLPSFINKHLWRNSKCQVLVHTSKRARFLPS